MKNKKINYIFIELMTFISLVFVMVSCFFLTFIYKGNNTPLLWSLIPLHIFIIFGELVLYALIVINKKEKSKSLILFYVLFILSIVLLASLLIVESMVLSS